ncbi:MAG: hypothetical protein ACREJT_05675 [Myxococcota bacterium]
MTRVYLIAAALALVGLMAWRVHHAVYESGYSAGVKVEHVKTTAAEAERDTALGANTSCVAAIDALRGDVASCQAGRLADEQASKSAIANAEKSRGVIAREFAKSRASTADKMAGECRDWAKQPACGSGP